MFDYKIILADGQIINASLNMNTWETNEEIDDSVFADNTDNVLYSTPEGETVKLGECKFIRGGHADGIYMFFLDPLTEEEKRAKRILQQIADVEDALCELAEMLSE